MEEEDLQNVDLNSLSFEGPTTGKAAVNPAIAGPKSANTVTPPGATTSEKEAATTFYTKAPKVEKVHWLQGMQKDISQRDLIERQMAVKKQQEAQEAAGSSSSLSPSMPAEAPAMTQADLIQQQMDAGQEHEGDSTTEGRKSLTIRDRVRKTAVAVGGSAIVGVGTALLFTPAHPAGHAVQLGGLGVLATEFEAPKKAYQKGKGKAHHLMHRFSGTKHQGALTNSDTDEVSNDSTQPSSNGSGVTTNESATDNSSGGAYVSPFRKTSLPNGKPPAVKSTATRPKSGKLNRQRNNATRLSGGI